MEPQALITSLLTVGRGSSYFIHCRPKSLSLRGTKCCTVADFKVVQACSLRVF